MTPPTTTILIGDVIDRLAELPEKSVQCVVTSPPYWGLRDYGTGTWIGGDPGCDHLGEPMRTKANINANCGTGTDVKNAVGRQPMGQTCGKCGATREDHQIGLEPTFDCGAWAARRYGLTPPECGVDSGGGCFICKMVAVFAGVWRVLRDDGVCWVNMGDSYASQGGAHGGRADNQLGVGAKRTHAAGGGDQANRTPPSGLKPKDRVMQPAILALALQAHGWTLRDEIVWHKPNPMPESVRDRCTKAHEYVFLLSKSARYYFDADAIAAPSINAGMVITYNNPKEITDPGYDGHRTRKGMHGRDILVADTRNRRSVWTVASSPFPDAHFATFPEPLIQPCILAGCPKGGIVLDPFGGAGTTGVTCKRMDRQSVLIELNQEYAEMARKRIDDTHVQQKLAL